MKSLAVALLLGAVSSEKLTAGESPNIWNDEVGKPFLDECGDPYVRWADSSNSWDTYKNAYLGSEPFVDNFFKADYRSIYSEQYPPSDVNAINYYKRIKGW